MPSSCELVRCEYYTGGRCTDKMEYVNEAGEPVCYRHDEAMPVKEYYEDVCPTCTKLQAENAKLRKALELACEEITDHDCPHEYDLMERDECKACPRGNEERYDAERDIKCWMRHYLEKAEGCGD